jgi:hypothetical protein
MDGFHPLREAPAAFARIPALDGAAEIWIHPADADLPSSVALSVTDTAVADPGGTVVSLSVPMALATAYALIAAAELAAPREQFIKCVPAVPGSVR